MKNRFRSFSKRLTRRIMFALGVTMAIVTMLVILFTFHAMRLMTISYYQSLLQVENESIQKVLYGVEVATQNGADGIEDNLGTTQDIYDALVYELKSNYHIIGFFAAFEPDYYPQQGRWFESYVYWNGDKIERKQVGSEKHDYHHKEWYQEALKSDSGYWSEPYLGETESKMLCSYVVPIRDKSGRKVGVFGADISLDWIHTQMRQLDIKSNADSPIPMLSHIISWHNSWIYGFIISKKGAYISHPDKEHILRKNFFDDVHQTSTPHDDELAQDMANGQKGWQTNILNGTHCFVFYNHLERTDWSMAIVVPRIALFIPAITIVCILLVVIGLGLLAVYWSCRYNIHHSTLPLKHLAKSADEVAKGNFQAPLPVLKNHDEILLLRDSFGHMQQSLTTYIEQLKATTAQKAAIDSELSIARSIQMSMLPPPFTERDDIKISASMSPAKAVGGDLYDYFVQGDLLYFCIGDVSGKGVPAALLMAVTKSLFEAYSIGEETPHCIVSRINQSLSKNNEACMFVTLFVGVLDLTSGLLRFCNAGHEPPLLIHDIVTSLPVDPAIAVGAFDDTNYITQELHLPSGASLLLYTDGLSEAMNSLNKIFGKKRIHEELTKAIAEHACSPQQLLERMAHAVHDYVGNTEQSDDLTMLCLSVRGLHQK